MAPKVNFQFSLRVDNPDMFPELEARTKNLQPAFEEIVIKWARNNEEKFARSMGAEESGAQVDPTVYWEALAASTIKSKRRHGFANQIMVATGALEHALEDPDLFFHEATNQEVAFGTPGSLEDEMKAVYNWKKRPAIFLGLTDQKMIEHTIYNYLSFGENWKEIMFARGLSNLRAGEEIASMDMAFNEAVSS